ncbi:cystathionine gamma-synthase [Photobacterium leiognathi subsp. mandapamensis]|nr:cystathionine gamma-synthase [Photobacterium leiognathi subsp. mandapamensis]
MKRLFAMVIAATIALTAALPAFASIDVYDFKNAEQEKQFQELTATLRCPKCQNNNIADSNATLAQDMRQKTFELLQEGKSSQQIIDYMIARYGNFVTYNPPMTASTAILWVGPILFIVIGFTVLVYRSRKNGEKAEETQLDAAEAERLKALLAEMEQQDAESVDTQSKVNK